MFKLVINSIEVWRPVTGYEGLYEVSNYGRVRSLLKKGIIRKNGVNIKTGYVQIMLSIQKLKKGFSVHRLVAQAFLPNPDNLPCVNHKDENKLNNFVFVNPDGSVDPEKSNLEWCTAKYNNNFGSVRERIMKTRNTNNSYSAEKAVLQMTLDGEIVKKWRSLIEAERSFNKNGKGANICAVLKGRKEKAYGFKWKYVL